MMDQTQKTNHLDLGLEELKEERDEKVTGVPSGFPRLDHLIGGWQDSDLIVFAGRPTMGKTSFAFSASQHAVTESKTSVAIFSLELSGKQVAQRLIMSQAEVDIHKARAGTLNDEEFQRLERVAEKLSDSPLHIDDTPRLTAEELTTKCRRLKEEDDIGLLVVDYLQLLRTSENSLSDSATRERELSYLTRNLKALAKELDVPVMVLSQLNREVENRAGSKRPQLSDLRGSGSIEQDADVVAFIYRAERYGITVDEQGDSTEGVAEIIVEKQRNGPVGAVELAFRKKYGRFDPHSEIDRSSHSGTSGEDSSFEEDAPF